MRHFTLAALSLALMLVMAACGSEKTPGGLQDPTAAGLPVVSAGSPLVNITLQGVAYYEDSMGSNAPGFNEDDFEFVGVSELNLQVPGSSAGRDVYRHKGDEKGYVYTYEPGYSFLNEDSRTITIDAELVRWSAAISTPTCTPTPGSLAAC